jgi:hypothetical protein
MAAITNPEHSCMAKSVKSLITTLAIAMVSTLLLTACATGKSYKTYDDYNPNIDFRNYQSFSFISESPMIISSAQGAVSPLLEGRIMNAIRANLSRKGFRYVTNPEQADMAISFTVGARDQIKVDQYPASYRSGYGSYYRGYGYRTTYTTETRVRQYTEGQLAIDIFDVRSKTPAFHGSASTRVNDSDRKDIETFINNIVLETLDGFPPGTAAHAQPNLVPLDPQPNP